MISRMKRPSDEGPRDLDELAESVLRLSGLLTRDRGRLPLAYLLDPGLREAYLRYFLPANLPKISIPLGELQRHPHGLLARDRLRVLDIGAGPGTSALGMLAFFSRQTQPPEIEFTAVDQVAENLRNAEMLFRGRQPQYGRRTTLRTIRCDAGDATARLGGRFDLIVLSNILNEIRSGEQDRIERRVHLVVNSMRNLLHEEGSCIIIEPALRETSRDLLLVRDSLLAAGYHVYSPCLIQASCPALTNPKDWCHEERPWDPPEEVREIDRRIGLHKDALKFSYLVLRRDARSLADGTGGAAFRVVSEPLVSRGKREFYLCGRKGRKLVVRLDRDAGPPNRPFDTLERGDLVQFENLVDEEKRWRVAKDTFVTPLHEGPWSEGQRGP